MKTIHLPKLYLVILCIGTILSLYIPKNEVTANETIVIPNEAIRLRILANSDSEPDQILKRKVRDAVNAQITEWVSELTSIEEARKLIKSRLPQIQEIAEQVLSEENSNQSVKTEFGTVEFPTKLYGQFLYPAGEYEAILITLGDGSGANWWCVLFPPLCFLDFSNGVAVSDGFEEEKQGKGETETVTKDLVKKETPKVEKKDKKQDVVKVEKKEEKQTPPVYAKEDEQPVEVKFFVKDLWEKLF